ncbi:MAG: hypothetical protein ABJA02_13180, partial [Acidobacteriota bacterium]
MNRTDWLECKQGGPAPQLNADYVSMNPRGHIVFGRVLYERLGSPAAFVLLYDPQAHRIGLRPAAAEARNACLVKRQGKHGGRVIRGYRLFYEFRIQIPEVIVFNGLRVDDEGVLIL